MGEYYNKARFNAISEEKFDDFPLQSTTRQVKSVCIKYKDIYALICFKPIE